MSGLWGDRVCWGINTATKVLVRPLTEALGAERSGILTVSMTYFVFSLMVATGYVVSSGRIERLFTALDTSEPPADVLMGLVGWAVQLFFF